MISIFSSWTFKFASLTLPFARLLDRSLEMTAVILMIEFDFLINPVFGLRCSSFLNKIIVKT
jgi:hypothetical protein